MSMPPSFPATPAAGGPAMPPMALWSCWRLMSAASADKAKRARADTVFILNLNEGELWFRLQIIETEGEAMNK
jgi:hypothetical protein